MFNHIGEIAALTTAVCWTVTAMAFETASKRVGSLSVNLIRLVLALIFLSFYTLITRGLLFPVDASPQAWKWLLLSGFIGFALGDLFLFEAFVQIGARISMLIMALVPPITALIGWGIMGESLSLHDGMGMGLTILGVSWVVLERKPDDQGVKRSHPIGGILLALGGAVGQSIGLVLSKKGMGDYSAFAATQIRTLAGIAGFILILTFKGRWPKVGQALRTPSARLPMLIGAVFGPFLGVSLSLVAVQYIATGVAATFMAITPVLIIAPAVLLFKEPFHWREAWGAVIALAGIAILYLT